MASLFGGTKRTTMHCRLTLSERQLFLEILVQKLCGCLLDVHRQRYVADCRLSLCESGRPRRLDRFRAGQYAQLAVNVVYAVSRCGQ